MKKKITALICSFVAVVSLIISGTFAMRDFNQHKTNILGNSAKSIDVTLNEEFPGSPLTNWSEGETRSMQVNVTNVNVGGNAQPVFVRLSLKEYMDIHFIKYSYEMDTATDERYRFLTYGPANTAQAGQFYVFDTYNDAANWAAANGFDDRVYPTSGAGLINALIPNDTPHFYIVTAPGDINGQYGKYLVTDIIFNTYNLIAGQGHWDGHATHGGEEFEEISGNENEYSYFDFYQWGDNSAAVRDYVQVNFGADVITLTEWISDGATPGPFWVYDDVSLYFYWAEPLLPGDTTTDFLNSLTLIQQPEGQFYYANRVDMEAVIADQLDSLTNTPDEMLQAWTAA